MTADENNIENNKKNKGRVIRRLASKKAGALVFILIFAVIGSALLWRSLAEDVLPTGANDVVLELSHGHGELGDGELLRPSEALPFRLYGNGLAVCGDYAESDTAHTAQYYAQTLTRGQMRSLVNSFDGNQFAQLDQMYVSAPEKAVASKSKVITYNTTSTSTHVTAFEDDSAVPKVFTNTEKAIEKLCSKMDTPYETENVVVRTKKIDSKLKAAAAAAEKVPAEIEAPAASETIHEQKDIEANQAKRIAKKSSLKKGSTYYKADDGSTVQAVASQQLPQATERKATNKKSEKVSQIFGVQKAKANNFGSVRVARFCATDACGGIDVNSFMASVRDWYTGIENKTYDTQNVGTIYGSHPAGYYAASGDTYGLIYNEMYASGQLNINGTPLELILGFGTGPRSWCGMANIPSDFSSKHILAITDRTDPGGGYSCSYGGHDYRTVAHELGHNFGLGHTTGQGQAGGIMGYDYTCTWPNCSLNGLQAIALTNHPLFYAIAGRPTFVAGQVTYGGKPMGGIQIETCAGQVPVTNGSGLYLYSIPGASGFCARVKNAPANISGPATNNQPEHKSAKTYEYQIVGLNCYHYCSGEAGTWDLGNDGIYNFRYADSRALAVRPGTSQGQRLDSWGKSVGFGGASNGSGIMFRDWNIARSVALNSSGQGYVLDGFGGLHPIGGAPSASGAAYWSGWDIARDVKLFKDSTKGYVLTGLGSLHRFNSAPNVVNSVSPSFQADLAKKLVIKDDGTGGYILDAYGGIHPFATGSNAMPKNETAGPYWPGWDIARSLVLNPAGTKGYILDGYGAVHPFAIGGASKPPAMTRTPSWPGWDIARDLVITDWTTSVPKGYVLDGYGGMHPIGG